MPLISEDTIQRVADASDIVEVIRGYIQLNRAGTSWKALCPFHNEKSPSFTVNPSRQTFKCFGCGAGGSVFRFVMDYEHIDFPSAIRKLAARAGIVVAEESAGDEVRRGERERLLALHRDAAAWFHENLLRQKFAAHAREYLKGRGIGIEIATRWQLGYAPDSWDSLIAVLRERGHTNDEILKSGLVSSKDSDRTNFYDRFRNRVMFPIKNDVGEVIAFSGRTLGDDPAKYVNSPETPIFKKGQVLFGLDKSKPAILAAREVVVCEGQLDMISVFEAGVENVTAPQGTAFTAQQARLLRRCVGEGGLVVLCFDSDTAGRKAVERSLPALLGANLSVRVARVPEGEDPDSMVRRKGAEAFRAVIAGARDYFDDVLEDELKPGATPQQRATLARKVAGFVKVIEDPALSEAVSARLRARMEISETAFTTLILNAKVPEPDREPEVVAETPEIQLSESARLLCRLAILSPEAREWMRTRPEPASIFGPEYALVDHLITADAALETPSVFSSFSASLPVAEERALAGLHVGKLPENPADVAADAWRGLLRQKLSGEIASVQARMRHPDTLAEEVGPLHKQILDLQEHLRDL
ncbi:MAG: DNA primase [Chthoniobacterales bacterium]